MNPTIHILRWTVRDANTDEVILEASGEGEIEGQPREEEALYLLADLCHREEARLGVQRQETPRRLSMTVDVLEYSTEWDANGPFNTETVIDTESCDRILPAIGE